MYFLLPFIFLHFIQSRYIKPYKNQAFDLSRPYALTPNIDFKITFSVTESQIPPSTYFIINFNSLSYFTNSIIGSPTNCNLQPFVETSGAPFDPLTDLLDDSNVNNPSFINDCFPVTNLPQYAFKLNQTLQADQIYQLSFLMLASFQQSATAISLFFSSDIDLSQNYIYSYNLVYDILIIKDLPIAYQNLSLISQPRYYSQVFYDVINEALSQSLLSYSQALLTNSDISVSSFNAMIENSQQFNLITWDSENYPIDIINYPGFFGNLILQIHIDQNITSFNIWELEVPNGWNIENSNCISVDFYQNNIKNTAIAHTKCIIDANNNQMLTFYNIFNITAPMDVRINITNIRNPMIPMTNAARFTLFDEKNKQYIYQNQSLLGLQVKNQQSLIVNFQTVDSILTKQVSCLVNRTQRIGISIQMPYFDLLGESLIIISQNNTANHGFIGDSCVIVNANGALETIVNRRIDCFLNQTQLIIRNIANIRADNEFEVYFINKNEETIGAVNFKIEIFMKNPNINDTFNTNSSYSFSQTIIMISESLTINDMYYTIENNVNVFDVYEVSSINQTGFYVEFAMKPSNKTQILTNESLNLILNHKISIDSDNLQCSLDTIIFSCSFNKTNDFNYSVISLIFTETNKNTLNLFDSNNHTLRIQGLSYQRTVANSYLFTFEYFLVYTSLDPQTSAYLLSFKTANLTASLNTAPNSSQILILGQGGNKTVLFSLSDIELSSEATLLYLQKSIDINALMLKIYFQNINHQEYLDNSNIVAKYPSDSITGLFIQGLNETSDNFLDWPYYEISNVQTSNYQDHLEIPIKLMSNPPIIYVQYYLVTTNANIIVLYDNFIKTSIDPNSTQTPDKLNLDWNATKSLNPNNMLNVRTSTTFVFAVNLSQTIIQPLITSGSGFFLFLLPWYVASLDKYNINCQFQSLQQQFPLNSIVLFDTIEQSSAIAISMQNLNLLSGYMENLVDNITCFDMMTPMSRTFDGGYGLVLDNSGNVLAKSVMNMEPDIFNPG